MGGRRVGLVFGVWVFVLLVAVFGVVLNVPVVWGSGTIYIRADGSIDPPTAPIQRDGDIYTFTDNIYDSIVVERNNIIIDGAGYGVQGSGSGKGIDLSYRSNVTIKNTNIKGFDEGIALMGSSNNVISGNNITANKRAGAVGVMLGGQNNIVSKNNITDNWDGIILFGSSNNIVSRNNITENQFDGIRFEVSSNNSVSSNTIRNNYNGVAFTAYYNFSSKSYITSSNNVFYHNNFIENRRQVYDPSHDVVTITPSINAWDDGYPSGGNYWSDYTGVDEFSGAYQNVTGSDGIGDTPYVIDANNRDTYPLMNPWTPPPDITSPVTTISLSGVLGENDWFTSDVTVTLSAIDDTEVDKAEYSFDNATWITYTVPFTITNEGNTIVYYKSTDKAGNKETTKTKTIKIDKTQPTANAGQDQTVNLGETVNFDASGSTDNVGIVSYEWDFGDGTTGTGKTTTHTYANPGPYTVTLTVKDAAGNTATDSITITVISPPPAEAFPMWIIGAATAIVAIGIALATTILRKRRK